MRTASEVLRHDIKSDLIKVLLTRLGHDAVVTRVELARAAAGHILHWDTIPFNRAIRVRLETVHGPAGGKRKHASARDFRRGKTEERKRHAATPGRCPHRIDIFDTQERKKTST